MIIYQLSYSEKPEIDEWTHIDLHVEGMYSSKELALKRIGELTSLGLVDPKIYDFSITPTELDSKIPGFTEVYGRNQKPKGLITRDNLVDERFVE